MSGEHGGADFVAIYGIFPMQNDLFFGHDTTRHSRADITSVSSLDCNLGNDQRQVQADAMSSLCTREERSETSDGLLMLVTTRQDVNA